ncbi:MULTISPECIES: virulence factor Mce family protein [Mycobacterium]|uniref:Mce family protein Mce3B n=1 Tax=Mycobacterium kiyosense TaxID=2871094 RepID=A0A9P3Q7P9_9MYCO|nr:MULTISPECIES: virulence factor Mce family protein [Mycobacterium]BDB39693.1 Mce family protein Mce3B [Mycobacterium kiyosense]BDE11549.1 Mce family protein Mce3B [Mycobacterium sp. 20KCMC460]GLB88926.1 Mce family protein Mce3B [Mycobacterium kiyosense]GLC02790.1 Mce family protein Mce3B [Mycobacterium kiyosense]GLC06060.1 Mce family protein Mce3B [Mycobacterium kiyosense]
MTKNLTGTVWRLGIFMMVCALALAATVVVFAQLRFGARAQTYTAQFTNVSGLRAGDMVRVAGVEVGKVKAIAVNRDATVRVEFSADRAATLTEGTRAEVRYDDLIGGRYLALVPGSGNPKVLRPGQTIPLDRTQPALDLDSVTGGFRPLFRALSPQQINDLSGQLLQAFQGQGPAIGSFLSEAAAVTNTLADRDVLIGQVVNNLNAVLGSLGRQSGQLDRAVTNLADLVHALAERKSDIVNAVAYTNAATGSVAELLHQIRPPTRQVLRETDRVAANVLRDHEYFDQILNTLPDSYRMLNRQGIYGDYFSFYFCDVVLKLNGKGGQPVYVKVAGQSSGRCTPR